MASDTQPMANEARTAPTGWYPDPERFGWQRLWVATDAEDIAGHLYRDQVGRWIERWRPVPPSHEAKKEAQRWSRGQVAAPGWHSDQEGRDRLWDGTAWTDEVRDWPVGYRPDPTVAGRLRMWDGDAWTDQTKAAPQDYGSMTYLQEKRARGHDRDFKAEHREEQEALRAR